MVERRRRRRGEDVPEVPSTDKSVRGSGLAPQATPPASPSPQAAAPAAPSPRAARAAEINNEDPPIAAKTARTKGGLTREENLAAAKARAAEILEHDIGIDDDDKYYVPPETIPDGWKYLWRRVSVYGKEDPQYQVKLAQTGWRPVPAERHPEMMPSTGGPYLTIDRDGMRLMEVPLEIYDLLAKKEQRKAIEQVRVKTAQLSQAPPGTFARDQHDKVAPSVRRGYEPLIVPDA
jgi:hypothetical protein